MSAEQILRDQIIKKAWEDAAFKEQLLTDPKQAIKEAFDITVPDHIQLKALEETSTDFYLVIPPNPSEASDVVSVKQEMW